jgi:hypothetical protein
MDYLSYERETLQRVIQARERAVQAHDVGQASEWTGGGAGHALASAAEDLAAHRLCGGRTREPGAHAAARVSAARHLHIC